LIGATMQAMQSRTASGLEVREEQFAASGYHGERFEGNQDERPGRRLSDNDSATTEGIRRRVCDLLRSLETNAALLELCGPSVTHSEQFQVELRELMDRSWRLTERLVECSEEQNGNHDDSVGEVFLRSLPCRGSAVKERARIEYVDPVSGITVWRGRVLEEAAAGWIAC
jgi:hypothetical protein